MKQIKIIELKLSRHKISDDDFCTLNFFKDRYKSVKKQVINHPEITNPKFEEWF